MRKLEKSYGKQAFDEWGKSQPANLRSAQTDPRTADRLYWEVSSFRELLQCVAFLSSMNKRLILFYRGQAHTGAPIPRLFRDSWNCFESARRFTITLESRPKYFDGLRDIGQQLCHVLCDEKRFRVPRQRGLQHTREIQWAIIQHYGLWPTPLIDVTSSLHVAAGFAMEFQDGCSDCPREGFLYVIGMPHSVGSITFNGDEHITLARLQSVCPPIARRPHYQEGFLIGHFPIFTAEGSLKEQSNLTRRLIAKFKLHGKGDFWDKEFPMFPATALLPKDDPLRDRLLREFGYSGAFSVHERAQQLER
jgi:FRG domain-containing protein